MAFLSGLVVLDFRDCAHKKKSFSVSGEWEKRMLYILPLLASGCGVNVHLSGHELSTLLGCSVGELVGVD